MHHAKVAADAMLGKLVSMWRDSLRVSFAEELLGTVPDAGRRDIDELDRWIESEKSNEELARLIPGTLAEHETPARALVAQIDRRALETLESSIRWQGDEGLLEHLHTTSAELGKDDSRRKAMADLAGGILNRKLYKPVARSVHGNRQRQRADAQRIWRTWGSHDNRRRLELEVGEYVGLDEKWHLVLFIPHPDMRLKPADMLVGGLRDDRVDSLHNHSAHCQDIYDSYEDLWAVTVFVHPSLKDNALRRDVALSYLREKLRIEGWENGPDEGKESLAIDHFAIEQRLLTGIRGLKAGPPSLNALFAQLQSLLDAGLGSTSPESTTGPG
jgi:hypothetical protein